MFGLFKSKEVKETKEIKLDMNLEPFFDRISSLERKVESLQNDKQNLKEENSSLSEKLEEYKDMRIVEIKKSLPFNKNIDLDLPNKTIHEINQDRTDAELSNPEWVEATSEAIDKSREVWNQEQDTYLAELQDRKDKYEADWGNPTKRREMKQKMSDLQEKLSNRESQLSLIHI